jgi:hypothetical protein
MWVDSGKRGSVTAVTDRLTPPQITTITLFNAPAVDLAPQDIISVCLSHISAAPRVSVFLVLF